LTRLLRAGVAAYARLPHWVRWLLVAVWATLIWFASSTEGKPGPSSFWWSYAHNFGHVVVYGILGVLWMCAVRGPPRIRLLGALVIAAVYGAVDEWHQSWVPRRSPSAGDLLSDILGAAWFGCVLLWIERPSRRLAWATLLLAPLACGAVLLAMHA
jgi:VanZ family protein